MIVAIDTGGTKTLITSFDAEGKIGDSTKFPTPHDPEQYFSQVAEAFHTLYGHRHVDAVVVAMPGTIRDGIVTWCGNLPWRNLDVYGKLSQQLPKVPILIENDAKLAGLGEARSLASTAPTVLYVTISTGINIGLVADGHIDPGTRLAEAGQIPLEYDGRIRTWESFASGKAIVATYKKFARDITSPRVWRQISDRIVRGLVVITPMVQPDIIIIGGSIGTYFSRYSAYLRESLEEHLPAHIETPKIIQAKHPEEAVVYGCYYYGSDHLDSL